MKLRTKLFIMLVLVQTMAMLIFLILAFHTVYSEHFEENDQYADVVLSRMARDLTYAMAYNEVPQIKEYLLTFKKDFSLSKYNIVQNITIKDDLGHPIVTKTFKTMRNEKSGPISKVVGAVLGSCYELKTLNVTSGKQLVGYIDLTISNEILIDSTVKLIQIIVLIWFILCIVVTFIYYMVLRYLTKNITALNKIVDNLEHDKYDMNDIKLAYNSDEISQLVNSIKQITSKIVKQTKLNQKLNLQKSILLANISNNMLTPLNAISGAIDILKINHASEDDIKVINFVESSANTLLKQITNILAYMELKESHVKLSFSTCIMSDLVYSSFKTIKSNLDENKKIKLNYTDNDENKIYVKADIEKLGTVFSNIIENAVGFTNSGAVNVQLSSVPVDNKYIRYQICVEDTGVGIPEKRLEAIKLSLNNADDENIQTKVSGLGLIISNLILKQMRGGLAVHSVENHGTTVIIEIIAEKSSISRVL